MKKPQKVQMTSVHFLVQFTQFWSLLLEHKAIVLWNARASEKLTGFARRRRVAALLELCLKAQIDDAVAVDDSEQDSVAEEGADHHEVGASAAVWRFDRCFGRARLFDSSLRRHDDNIIVVG